MKEFHYHYKWLPHCKYCVYNNKELELALHGNVILMNG